MLEVIKDVSIIYNLPTSYPLKAIEFKEYLVFSYIRYEGANTNDTNPNKRCYTYLGRK